MSADSLAGVTQELRSSAQELDTLRANFEIGEPALAAAGARSRFGSFLRRRLYRFLWWQNQQIGKLLGILAHRDLATSNLVAAFSQDIENLSRSVSQLRANLDILSQRIAHFPQQLQDTQHIVFESRRQHREQEARLAQCEDAARRLELEQTTLRDQVESARRALEALQRFAQEHEPAAAAMRGRIDRLEATHTQTGEIAARVSDLGLYAHQTRASLSIQERRLALFLDEARKSVPENSFDEGLSKLAQDNQAHRYDSLYMSFEDVFRGSREDIKSRQAVYLSYLNERGVGSLEMPVFDLGCGRGEWLELLREHDLKASGVDSNERMVNVCQSFGLDVRESDAIASLRALPDASVGAVTSFHMVEHMPFDVVMTLVDEALRALKSGGVLILETPNPENLLVAAYTFHLDPTHRKPLPSLMLRFFVEARGFSNVHIKELHPYPETMQFPEDSAIARRLNRYLYGPQDYAVIGQKP